MNHQARLGPMQLRHVLPCNAHAQSGAWSCHRLTYSPPTHSPTRRQRHGSLSRKQEESHRLLQI
jgi:hypothetical protein